MSRYTRTNNFPAGQKARGSEVKAELDAIQQWSADMPDSDTVWSGAVNFAQATGTANALAVALDNAWTTYTGKDGYQLCIRATANSTAAVTLAVDGLATRPVVRRDGTALTSGDLKLQGVYSFVYNEVNERFHVDAFNEANIKVVVDNIANVNLVAGSIANVNTVAGSIGNVNIVAGAIANVNAVGASIANVNIVAGSDANIAAVAGNAANINAVAGNNANVAAVADNETNINAAVANETNIDAAVANEADISTVASSIANVNATGGSIANVNTVATNIANVNTVATNIANVNTTATNIANVNTVAGISANVSTVAGIAADVVAAPTHATTATTQAGIATTQAGIATTQASNASTSASAASSSASAAAGSATAANNSANASAASAAAAAAIVNISSVQTFTNPLSQAVRVAMTAATSGSNGIQVLNNANANFGTNNFTLHWEGSLQSYATGAIQVLWLKHNAVTLQGYIFTVSIAGELRFFLAQDINNLRLINVVSTTAIQTAANRYAKFTAVVVRETPASAGSLTFYENGIQLGNAIAITAATTVNVANTENMFISSGSVSRPASDTQQAIIYNRALSAAEVLSLCVNGPALADIGASQVVQNVSSCANSSFTTFTGASASGFQAATVANATNLYAGTADEIALINGRNILIEFDCTFAVAGVIQVRLAPSFSLGGSASPTVVAGKNIYVIPWPGTTTTGVVEFRKPDTTLDVDFTISNLTVRAGGITGQWNAENAQSNTGQIFDSSGNRNHALLPAAGATIIGRPTSQQRQVRWTNTWAGTQELQYIGGVNQAILPANAYIESIVGTVTGATPHDIIIGDGSDTDRYVTITTGLAAGTTTFTLASRVTDGTNLKLTVDPDTNATMSIAWVITYTTLES